MLSPIGPEIVLRAELKLHLCRASKASDEIVLAMESKEIELGCRRARSGG